MMKNPSKHMRHSCGVDAAHLLVRDVTKRRAWPIPRGMRSRGAIMMEMVLVLPLLVFVLLLVFYFGRGVVRLQHAQMMDRYEAWRQVTAQGVPAPQPDPPRGNPQMNQAFFGGAAQSIVHDQVRWFPSQARDALVTAAGHYSPDGQALAADAHDLFASGLEASFATTHATGVPLWQPFEGAIRHRHLRIAHEWKFASAWRRNAGVWIHAGGGPWMLDRTRSVFLVPYDDALDPLVSAGNPLAQMLVNLPSLRPGYAGPNLPVP